jgi:hypothetical protein
MKQESVTPPGFFRISLSKRIEAAPERAWDLITDTSMWSKWGPSVRTVECPDRHIREGTQGYLTIPFGFRLRFIINQYIRGRFWGWKVSGIQATGHRLTPLGRDACKISFEFPAWFLPYAIVCRIALARLDRILKHSDRIVPSCAPNRSGKI